MPRLDGLSTPIWVVDLTTPDWKEDLYCAIDFVEDPKHTAFYRGGVSFTNVIRTAREELNAKFAVIEDYISTDYSDEYAAFHSRVLQRPQTVCKRIHFFANHESENKATEPTLDAATLLALPDGFKAAYLGYCVLRPLRGFRVGDTILRSPHVVDGADLVHCQARYTVCLLGNRLTVVGCPFTQQDTQVTICAGAALWTVGRYMNRIGETRRYRPSEVTRLAKAHRTLGATRDGLDDIQIVDALRLMELNPHCTWARSKQDGVELLYTCVESELPVMVSVGLPTDQSTEVGHVVTVIGHDFTPSLNLPDSARCLSEAVNAFIVHDDAAGPYLTQKVGEGQIRNDDGKLLRTFLTLDDHHVYTYTLPFPPRVNLRGEDATEIARACLTILPQVLSDWEEVAVAGVVTRTYLRRSSKFKEDVIRGLSNGRGMHSDFAMIYRGLFLPRYVWVVELASISDIHHSNPQDRLIRGEVILDATAAPYEVEYAMIACHLDGRLLVRRNPLDAHLEFCKYGPSEESPYAPMKRHITKVL